MTDRVPPSTAGGGTRRSSTTCGDRVRSHTGQDRAVVTPDEGDRDTRVISYAELARLTDRCAGALHRARRGARRHRRGPADQPLGDRPLLLGCMRAGARSARCCPATGGRAGAHARPDRGAGVRHDEPTHDGDAPRRARRGAWRPSCPRSSTSSSPTGPRATGGLEELDLRHRLGGASRGATRSSGRELGPDDPYLVLFTSGTTGEPEGRRCTARTRCTPRSAARPTCTASTDARHDARRRQHPLHRLRAGHAHAGDARRHHGLPGAPTRGRTCSTCWPTNGVHVPVRRAARECATCSTPSSAASRATSPPCSAHRQRLGADPPAPTSTRCARSSASACTPCGA